MYVNRNYLNELVDSQTQHSQITSEVMDEIDGLKSIFVDYCITFKLWDKDRVYENKNMKVYFDYEHRSHGYGKFIIERKTSFYRKNVVLIDSFFHIAEDRTVQINESALDLTPIDGNDIERLFIDMKQDMLNHFDKTQSRVDLYKALQEV